ncbi:tetratricopeptide repeat protein [Coraliomargarita parva]|uniref:tetratricopeptide repeat protein n=1 Tax=Coraliomargarita parva TaxID=3014050 RepID=UPI0022B36546|nr:hypothetical protein [Coraliomargarita parva]
MWKICVSTSCCLILAQALVGQGLAPSMGAPAQQPAQMGASAPTGGFFESNTFLEMANRVFNPDSDSMDFQEGSYVWKGRSFNLTDQRAFRSRFERYLLDSPSSEAEQYEQLMSDILSQLSVINHIDDSTVLSTWELLFRAAEFDLDGGNSIIVANQVFNAWRVRQESRGTALSQRELEELRSYQQEIVANRSLAIQRLKERRLRESSISRRQSNNGSSATEEDSLPTEAAFRALDLAETEMRIAALEAQSAVSGMQAKLQFQSQVVTFLMQRRFQHALILSGFYQQIFKGSQQQLEVGKEELTSFFPNSDLSFTVDTLSFVSREAVNDVNAGVDAVNAAYGEGRKMIALERLQETFFLGEYLPSLNRIPVGQRRDMLDLYRYMLEAKELAQAKDYDGVTEMSDKISRIAPDFPKARVESSVNTAKSMSDMAVFAAAQYRNLGQIDKAREELQQAIEIWPSNPSIREFQQETTKLATASSKGVQVFDDLYERMDRRGIYDRRMELGFALSDDTERRPLLLDVVDQVAQIESLIKQSEELEKQGDPYAAWEFLAEAAKIDPDDAPMNRARADLAPRVAEFVSLLNRAERQDAEGHPAAALASYLAAQDVYPASRLCRQGVARMSKAIMSRMRSESAVPAERD